MGVIVHQNRVSRKKPELLGPGGSLSQALWAFEGGADAVYAGFTAYSARAQAENLDQDAFARLIRAAHQESRKVYGAFNTLVSGTDLPGIIRTVWELWYLGLDAVIIQDPGLLRALLRHGPPVDLHASTQMAIQDASGARRARDSGLSRVVLARELTLEEMATIRQAVPDLELEVFVAGAQCYGASGQCQASWHLLDRSANKGSCAQLCRNRLDLPEGGGKTGKTMRGDGSAGLSGPEGPGQASGSRLSGTWFSMNDLDLMDHLEDLVEIGIDSLKIEGRMKGPLYARSLCRAWRYRLDHSGRNSAPEAGEVARNLDQAAFAFSRDHTGGFSGSVRGSKDLINHDWAGSTGRPLGKVVSLDSQGLTVRLLQDLAVKDGILLRCGEVAFRTAVDSLQAVQDAAGQVANPQGAGKGSNRSGSGKVKNTRHESRPGPRFEKNLRPPVPLTQAKAGSTLRIGIRQEHSAPGSNPGQGPAGEFRSLLAAWKKGLPLTASKVSDHSLKLPEFPDWPARRAEQDDKTVPERASLPASQQAARRPRLVLKASGRPGELLELETRLVPSGGMRTGARDPDGLTFMTAAATTGDLMQAFEVTSTQACQSRTGNRGLGQATGELFIVPAGLEARIEICCPPELETAFLPPSVLKDLWRTWKEHLLTALEGQASRQSLKVQGDFPGESGVGKGPRLRRSGLSPRDSALPFLGARDLSQPEILPEVTLRGQTWRVACLDPLCFEARSRDLATALEKLLARHELLHLLVGMNNLSHLALVKELADRYPGRVLAFADWLMNLCNRQALAWLTETAGPLLAAWMTGAEGRKEKELTAPGQREQAGTEVSLLELGSCGVVQVEWDREFDPPVFLSRSCFTSRSRGLPCPLDQAKPACPTDRAWKPEQGKQAWKVLVHHCQTYSWLR